jgi:uncharacterized protein (DUF488 family)
VKLFTIGFTQRTAESFFTGLQQAGVRRVVDIRLHNTSQLAGFAKAADLEYFLRAIAGIGYLHRPDFAPTPEILDAYKKSKSGWEAYEQAFTALMVSRRMENLAEATLRDNDCLMCSEPTADKCHRRLVAEYLCQQWRPLEIVHL